MTDWDYIYKNYWYKHLKIEWAMRMVFYFCMYLITAMSKMTQYHKSHLFIVVKNYFDLLQKNNLCITCFKNLSLLFLIFHLCFLNKHHLKINLTNPKLHYFNIQKLKLIFNEFQFQFIKLNLEWPKLKVL